MVKSLRRIFSTLLFIGIFTLCGTTAYSLLTQCTEAGTCLASVIFGIPEYQVSYNTDFNTALSTQTNLEANISSVISSDAIKALSVVLIFVGVFVLLALEAVELYYIRLFWQNTIRHKKLKAR